MRAGKRTVWRRSMIALIAITVCVAIAATFLYWHSAYAAGAYTSGEAGSDISWPQCGKTYPAAPYAFGVVGVTSGRAFNLNSCLASEYAWAQAATYPSQLSLYMNLNYPVGSTATEGQSGPYGANCKKGSVCAAENYGWNAAQYAFTQNNAAAPVSASIWWIDVETGNSWSKNTALNADVVLGAISYLQSKSVTAGVYSTATQWKTIAGTYAPNTPNWVAGASATNPGALCTAPLYKGGVVWLTQYTNSAGFDVDYAC